MGNSAWIVLHLMAKVLILKTLPEAQKLESGGFRDMMHCLNALWPQSAEQKVSCSYVL